MNTRSPIPLKLILLLLALSLAACAGNRREAQALNPSEQVEVWAETEYKPALAQHAAARTQAELTQAIDKLAAAAESAPIPEARLAAERNACLAAAANADAAVMVKFDCENGSLKALIGGY